MGLADVHSSNWGFITAYTAGWETIARVSVDRPQEEPVRLDVRPGKDVSGRLRVNGLSASMKTEAPLDTENQERARLGAVRARGFSSTTFRPENDRLRLKVDFDLHGGSIGALLFDLDAEPGHATISEFYFGFTAKDARVWKFDVDPSHRYDLELSLETDWGTSADTRLRASLESFKPVPEPASILMLASGLAMAGFAGLRRRR